MRSCYYEKLSPLALAVLDNCDYYGDGRIITRINVPKEFRGRGIGHKLLLQCLADADAEGVTLWLEINAYGDMTYEQLESWYKRHGFKGHGIYKRKPNK